MKCDRIWELLSVYADAEATREEAVMVETHIAVCSTCARDLRFMVATSGVLNLIPEIEPPAALHTSILSATVFRPTWQQRLRSLALLGFASNTVRYGALAGAAAAAFIVLRPIQSPLTLQPSERTANPEFHRLNVAASTGEKGFGPTENGNLSESHDPALKTNSSVPKSSHIQLVQSEDSVRKNGNIRPLRLVQKFPVGSLALASISRPQFNSKESSADARVAATPVEPVEPPSELPQISPAVVMGGMMPPVDMMDTARGEGGTTESVNTEAMGAPATAHITLASETSVVPTDQMVTLADLKRSLRKQTSNDHARFVRESIKDKQIRLDVVRGRF